MESSRPVAFFALDVAPPLPLVILLSAIDIIVLWMTMACSPSSASSPSPSPSPPPQHVDKGKGQQTPVLPLRPPSPQPLDQGDEDSDTETGGGGGEGGDDEKELQDERIFHQPSRATVERILILQPKGIRSLGLKQLGVKLNWSDDTYEHMVYLQNDVINYIDHWLLAQIAQRLCKKKGEEVRTEAVKRTAIVIQEAVAPQPRVITVKKKKAGSTPGPTTAPLPPCRTSQYQHVKQMPNLANWTGHKRDHP
ncbi:hypothetical protein IW261DRAFT_1421844 [Armillaria novae-zelandiae]|uniref:Uncharacterized protein n=1 Tax=Armillaria novae-zelandiae TaxID=153914 RepID=A0AA39P304_9AGAR|nr:hypothetical protein IW261DRAFT_1421844 [Armillaria novae-zelandiae]